MFKNKVVWIIIAIVAILFFWVKGVYNNMVTQDEGVKPHGAKLRTNINAVWI